MAKGCQPRKLKYGEMFQMKYMYKDEIFAINDRLEMKNNTNRENIYITMITVHFYCRSVNFRYMYKIMARVISHEN